MSRTISPTRTMPPGEWHLLIVDTGVARLWPRLRTICHSAGACRRTMPWHRTGNWPMSRGWGVPVSHVLAPAAQSAADPVRGLKGLARRRSTNLKHATAVTGHRMARRHGMIFPAVLHCVLPPACHGRPAGRHSAKVPFSQMIGAPGILLQIEISGICRPWKSRKAPVAMPTLQSVNVGGLASWIGRHLGTIMRICCHIDGL